VSSLRLFLLGPPRVERDGVTLKFRYRKNLALLAYLAVAGPSPGGESHTRESLITLLWPELEPSRARAILRRNLSLLRKALNGQWLVVDRETIGLDPDADIWVDVDQFHQRLAACQTHHHPPTEACPDCLPLLEEAVGLYRGDFLAGFTLPDSAAFDEWQFFQTEGLKDELAGALVRLATYRTSQGDFESAISHARRWQALDPLHEPAHRHLMVLYTKSGQRAAALRQYETCRQLLADELGVEPSEGTQETYERLLKGELPVGPSAVEAILERELRTVGECPYRGLTPFREADAPFFFGRESFTRRLTEAVRTRPMVAVIVGSSGSGKSSAVFAGLLPRLREEGRWLIAGLRPGARPFDSLAAALLSILEPELSETDRLIETRKLADALSEEDIPVYDVVERALKKSGGMDRSLLLVDQFEELYTLCPEPEIRRRLVDALLTAVETVEKRRDSALVLLLTMRADFMGQALAHRPFADALQKSSLMLGPMTREELRAAIEKPAGKQGAALQAGLVERLLDDVGDEPGNLPLLEFALTLLWERLDYGWMTHAAYEAIGRVEGALARYAEEVYEGLEEEERERARRIFTQLVQPGEGTEDTRRVATRSELGDENWALVQYLADKRLVVTGQDPTTGREMVEVVHEALIQRWGQLRGWMAEDRAFRIWQERLRAALGQWQATGQDEGVLLRGAPLAEAENWLGLAERKTELSGGEKAFIQASVALRERQAVERGRRRRRIFAGLTTGLFAALLLALLAVSQWRRAEGEEREALVQASVGLASQALLELEGTSPERAVLLALEALKNYPYTPQAERALGQAVLGDRLRLILQHGGMVDTVWWSSDGSRILTAGDDGTAKVWDATTGEKLLTLSGHQASVLSAVWSPSGDRIVTASEDGTARIWDAVTGEELFTFTRHGNEVFDAKWSPDGTRVATASDDGTARVWDAATGEESFSLRTLSDRSGGGKVSGVAWSPDGSRIVTTYYGGIVWNAATGEELLSLRYTSGVRYAMWSPDGMRIVTVSYESARVWDATTGEVVFTFPLQTGDWQSATWSPSGETIATTDWDGNAKIWDAATGNQILDLYPEDYTAVGVMDAVWSPSGDRLATVSYDGTATVWDTATGAELVTLVGHTSALLGAAWSPSGDRIVTAGVDGTAKVWDVAPGPELLTLYGHTPAVNTVMWSPSGDRIVTSSDDGMAKIWDATTGAELRTLLVGAATDAVWSPSGEQIATGDHYGWVTVWDAATGDRILSIPTHHYDSITFGGMTWSPGGDRIATSSRDGTAKVFDATTGELLITLQGHEGPVFSTVWSPDGERIVTAGYDGTARVWDATNGRELRTLCTLDSGVTWAVWSADGRHIVAHSNDGLGRMWHTTTGKLLMAFTGHSSTVGSMSWSPAGDRLLTGSMDGTARVWDASTGAELMSYSPGGMIYQADWSPDGTRIAVASQDGTTKVLPAWQTLQELIDYAKECCVIRELTAEEREQFGLGPR
jgi:WD40 repeat protein/DNA-binding SARP family transcriptional activator